MNKFLEAVKAIDNYTYTENGAVAYKSTGNKCLDAFGSLAAMKDSSPERILDIFYSALYEDRELALRMLFYVRDVRGGQGMRRVFRIIARSLAFTHPEIILNNLDNFLFFGRGDDLLCLEGTPIYSQVMDYMFDVLLEDMKTIGTNNPCTLLAKWMPSVNTSSNATRKSALTFISHTGISIKEYRQMLSALRKKIDILERYMSQNKWEEINFVNIPSRASMIYTDAFIRHCNDAYTKYLEDLAAGKASVNAGALFPVDILHKVLEGVYSRKQNKFNQILYGALWDSLPNYFGDSDETGICVVDTSGSMSGTPIEVALSLGMYCADKCKGPFKNHFITFSGSPKLQEIVGNNIFEKTMNMINSNWGMNTDVEAVFDLILDTALSSNLSQSDLPSKLYIISDMQFDACAYKGTPGWGAQAIKPETLIESMRKKYSMHGYTLPSLIFWNVRASNCGMFQLKGTDGDCCMVSGYSPSLFKSVIEGTEFIEEEDSEGNKVVRQKIDPINVMRTTLMNERYDRVNVNPDWF